MSFHVEQFTHDWIPKILDKVSVAITIFDLQGIMLYYNEYAPKLLKRSPDLLGKDIRLCHKKPESNSRVNGMIEEFNQGRREPISYEAKPYGQVLLITVSPLEIDGRLVGCIHTAIPQP
jgi:PAS domain S-box-containing protein